MGRNLNKLTVTTAAALALAGGILGCGGTSKEGVEGTVSVPPPPYPSHVNAHAKKISFDVQPNAAQQARRIQTQLNAAKKVTSVTIEVGYQIPVREREIVSDPAVVEIDNPIKLGEYLYAYKSAEGNNGLRMRAIRYAGQLLPMRRESDLPETQDSPHEMTTDIAAVYSEFPIAGGGTGRFYTISTTQAPGPHYNAATISAGEPVDLGCTPWGGCG